MSFAKDDIGLTNLPSIVQAGTFNTRIVKESSDPEKVVTTEDPVKSERLVLSENLDKRLSSTKDSLDQSQEGGTMLDIVSNSYSSISDTVSEMEKKVKDVLESDGSDKNFTELSDSIKKNLEDIEKTIKDTTFDGKQLLDGSIKIDGGTDEKTDISAELKDTSLEALGLPATKDFAINSKEDAEALAKTLDSAKNEIIKRQASVSNSQNEIQKNMKDLFLTEINLLKDNESENNTVDQTKSNVISGILDDPSKSVKIQIKSLDTGVLIALIKLHA